MAFTDLTPEQQQQVFVFVGQLRKASSTFFTLANEIDAINLYWGANAQALLGQTAGIPVPDPTNLPGATTLTDSQIAGMVSFFATINSTFNLLANRNVLVLATGPGEVNG